MPYKTRYGSHYHMTEGWVAAIVQGIEDSDRRRRELVLTSDATMRGRAGGPACPLPVDIGAAMP